MQKERLMKLHPEYLLQVPDTQLSPQDIAEARKSMCTPKLLAHRDYQIRCLVENFLVEKFDPVELVGLNGKRFFMDKRVLSKCNESFPYMATSLGSSPTDIIYLNLMTSYHLLGGESYVISKDFFDTFKDTDIGALRFKHLPKYRVIFVKLPYTIPIDSPEGTKETDQFYFSFLDYKTYGLFINRLNRSTHIETTFSIKESNYCSLCHFGQTEYQVLQLCDCDDDRLINDKTLKEFPDSPVYAKYVQTLFNILAYINSGDPDIRAFRNDIRYQSPTSRTPVRADKPLAQDEINLVGYSWKKGNLSHKPFWVVDDYYAHRWVGSGENKMLVRVPVKGSLRRANVDRKSSYSKIGE